jgi:hypothetical protein
MIIDLTEYEFAALVLLIRLGADAYTGRTVRRDADIAMLDSIPKAVLDSFADKLRDAG